MQCRYYLKHVKEPDNSADIAETLFSKAKRLSQVKIHQNCIAPTIRAEYHGNKEFRRHANGINTKDDHLSERYLTLREVFIFNKKKDMAYICIYEKRCTAVAVLFYCRMEFRYDSHV